MTSARTPPLLLPLLLAACASNEVEPPPATGAEQSSLTYYRDAKPIIDARCATCHRAGDIGPFPLTSHAEVFAFAAAARSSIARGTMPPWKPSRTCNTYLEDIDLTDAEKITLLAWLDAGAPAGDPADAPDSAPEPPDDFVPDYALRLPEPYTPSREPDDYRCQLISWPGTTTEYVTGLRVRPDQRALVHHVIVFVARPDEVEQYRAFDAAEAGPGYTCYGGPRASGASLLDRIDPAELFAVLARLGIQLADLRAGNLSEAQLGQILAELGVTGGGFDSLGSWVPGIPSPGYPAGTGIRIEPGSALVVQVHYNTLSSAPVPDQSVVEVEVAAEVEREAANLAALDFGWVSNGVFGDPMTIPAGAIGVEHSTRLGFDSILVQRARDTLGLPPDAPLVLHTANHHMHQLGRRQLSEVRHADGSATCLLDIPDWDFDWQGSYTLARPVTLRAGDALWMGCTWDNGPADQPIIDGVVRAPADVSWGESTSDEMCLGSFYVTAE